MLRQKVRQVSAETARKWKFFGMVGILLLCTLLFGCIVLDQKFGLITILFKSLGVILAFACLIASYSLMGASGMYFLHCIRDYQQVIDWWLVRTIDGKALVPGDWFCCEFLQINPIDCVYFKCAHQSEPEFSMIGLELVRGLKITFSYEVVDLGVFAKKMAKVDFDTVDLIMDELEIVDDLLDVDRQDVVEQGQVTIDGIHNIEEQIARGLSRVKDELWDNWGLSFLPQQISYQVGGVEIYAECINFSGDESPQF